MKLLLRHDPPRSSVLDLASGGGAMLARLRDAGFSDLHEVVRDPKVFGQHRDETAAAAPESPAETTIVGLDLNGRFADRYTRRFNLIVTSEVIEHLESPRGFLGQVSRLLEDDGLLLVTTPNVANWVGRIRFLLFGELRWFDETMRRQAHHVSPLTDSQMRALLAEAGFDVIATTSAGNFAGPLLTLLTAPLSLPFLALLGRRGWGDCNIYLAKRPGSGDRRSN